VGAGRYLYRAVDSTSATIDFWFSNERDAATAKQFFQKDLQAPGCPQALDFLESLEDVGATKIAMPGASGGMPASGADGAKVLMDRDRITGPERVPWG
jgi:hypothetical protein